MTEPESSEPKIVVDTDWKEQVAREKEAAARQASAAPSAETAAASATEAGAVAPSEEVPVDEGASGEGASDVAAQPAAAGTNSDLPPLPKASFETLVSMLFTQAMATLGQFPDPATGKAEVDKSYAKHYIDTLDVLREKTQGNLSDDEAKLVSEALHALRMTFVQVRQSP